MSEKNNHIQQTAYDEHGFLNVREYAIQFKRGSMLPRLCRHCDDPQLLVEPVLNPYKQVVNTAYFVGIPRRQATLSLRSPKKYLTNTIPSTLASTTGECAG